MDSFALLRNLFSFNTDHWIDIEANGVSWKLKYIPLSLKEKINIFNKFDTLPEEEKNLNIVKEQCSIMLRKGNSLSAEQIDKIPSIVLSDIYKTIIQDITDKKTQFEEFYEKHKTVPVKKANKKAINPLDTLLNIGFILKETNMSLEEVSNLDELSLFAVLVFINETNVRESNSYEESSSKSKR